jgi:hypothetical protein
MTFPTKPDAMIPHFDVNADLGNFVYAVSQMPPGKAYMAEGSTSPWSEYLRAWGDHNGVKTKYQEITLEQFIAANPDKDFGIEAGDMFAYSSDPGYDGGDETLLKTKDIRAVSCQFGFVVPNTDWGGCRLELSVP